jgi:glycosyltransferase involved in cell wall biosynthesis
VKLSILLPNKNEENIHAFIEEVEKEVSPYEIIVARDREGKGKGWAIRTALQQAPGDWICFLDADGDIHPRMLKRLITFTDDFDIVVGSKRICKTNYRRKIITFFSRVYIAIFFGIACDTQTGIKLFRRSAIHPWITDGFLFDVEILSKASNRGNKIVEVPIECEIKKQMPWRTLWKTALESIVLWFRLSFPAKQSMITPEDVSESANLF